MIEKGKTMVDERETAYWYAVRSEDTDELDNGSYDYEEAEKLFDKALSENGAAEILKYDNGAKLNSDGSIDTRLVGHADVYLVDIIARESKYRSEYQGGPVDDRDVINAIDHSESWDDVDSSWYRKVCEDLGLDYDSYDDPDILFLDMKDALDRKAKEGIYGMDKHCV